MKKKDPFVCNDILCINWLRSEPEILPGTTCIACPIVREFRDKKSVQ